MCVSLKSPKKSEISYTTLTFRRLPASSRKRKKLLRGGSAQDTSVERARHRNQFLLLLYKYFGSIPHSHLISEENSHERM